LPSQIAAAFVAFSAVLHYAATYFLSKYSDKFMDPTAIVVFGPYRFVRHPIYASFMLLFAGYSIALRAYWSLALLLAASLLYYQRRADIEESLLEKAFPGQYQAYKDKVKYKFFWLVY
jgi:protein-S-isoprenylcysteine O-methyltransferase Ste14